MVARKLPRDAWGRKIPREGTKSRRIYDLLLQGLTNRVIAERLDMSKDVVKVLVWQIRNPEDHARYQNSRYRPKRVPRDVVP